jgi:hypothetical protein
MLRKQSIENTIITVNSVTKSNSIEQGHAKIILRMHRAMAIGQTNLLMQETCCVTPLPFSHACHVFKWQVEIF